MPFTRYASTDSGAPVLNGVAGSLIDLLHAVLVTGYGTQAAAGWTRPWLSADTNEAVFQPDDDDDAFYYFNDNAPGAGAGREARFYMGMAHDGSGNLTNKCPQNTTLANGYFLRKSLSTATTARDWEIWADSKTAYIFTTPGDGSIYRMPYLIGKAIPVAPTEAYPWIISGRVVENSTNGSPTYNEMAIQDAAPHTYRAASCPVQADGSATGTDLQGGHLDVMMASTTATAIGTNGPGAPGPRTGILPLWDGLLIHDYEPRLHYRGLISAYCAGALGHGDTFTATIRGISRSYEVLESTGGAIFILETSDTLDT